MDVACGQIAADLAGHGAGLGDLLALEAVALEHVEEVGVAAEVQLVGAVEPHAALAEQVGEQAVDDRRTDLGLDVVADQRQPRLGEAVPPFLARRDEHGDAVDEGATRGQRLRRVRGRRLLRAHRQVADQDVGSTVAQVARHVVRCCRRFLDDLAQVPPKSVEGRAAPHLHAELATRNQSAA
jgi:hypothetical protein